MRLYSGRALHHRTNRFDLGAGYTSRLSPASDHIVNTGSCKDGKPAIEGSTQEHVTREEGERNPLDPVFPLVGGRVEGQESFKPFPGQGLMDTLLVLMASIKGVPEVSSV